MWPILVLRRLHYDPARMEQQVIKSMENYGVHIVAALEKHLPVLATIASVAPMLGFLGTVQGMIVAFGDIEANIGQQNIVQAFTPRNRPPNAAPWQAPGRTSAS